MFVSRDSCRENLGVMTKNQVLGLRIRLESNARSPATGLGTSIQNVPREAFVSLPVKQVRL